MRTYLIDTTKLFCSVILTFLIFILPVKSQTLTEMVNQIIEDHEDIINAQKELEEAGRDVTDSQLAYAPDISVKYEGGQTDKYDAASNHQIDGFDTWDVTWKQKIMDSGATLMDIGNKRLELDKQELEFISSRNDLLIEAADA